MRQAFWQWAHRTTEKLWHWIYYNKILRLQKIGSGVSYRYTYEYKNSADDSIKVYRIDKDDSIV